MSKQKYEKRLRNTGRSTGSTQDVVTRPVAQRWTPSNKQSPTGVGNVHRRQRFQEENAESKGGTTPGARSSPQGQEELRRETQTTRKCIKRRKRPTRNSLLNKNPVRAKESPQATTAWAKRNTKVLLQGRGSPRTGHLPTVRGQGIT